MYQLGSGRLLSRVAMTWAEPSGRRARSRRTRRWLQVLVTAGLVSASVALGAPTITRASAADLCATPVVNKIACENSKPGNPQTEWDTYAAGDPSIQGFSTDQSVNIGGTIHFKVNSTASSYRLDIYRLGWYQGNGGRKIATVTPSVPLPQSQPACLSDTATGLVDCGNWAESASWTVPSDAVSGVYIAHLVRPDTNGDSHIMFVVRDDSSHADIVYQTSDTTWQAYNTYGGNSLYSGQPAGRAYKVSYNRPNILRGDPNFHRTNFFADEFPMVRWLERNGYDMSYISGVDTDRAGATLLQHKTYISSGHDEYWSAQQRANVEAARANGVNLSFFSGNEVFWKTRWEPSIDGSGTSYRTLVTYKETANPSPIDPQFPAVWTGTWRDPRYSPPSDGGRPENALTGTIFTVNCCETDSINVSALEGKRRFWRNTSLATMSGGQTATLGGAVVGYEWDEDVDNGSRPAGLFDLSTTTVSVGGHLTDYGVSYSPGTATHHLTMYRAASGALVFGAGTVRWSWGLDDTHDDGSSTPDVRVQQATVNLLADMSAQPATLQSGLVAATATTDHTAPTSTITAPTPGTSYLNGTTVTITGTAVENGGGQLTSVEVSTDGGTTWHRANGLGSWTYTWSANSVGTTTIKSRAVDDSANLEVPSAGVAVNVTCPCSIWTASTQPAQASAADNSAVELGVRFRSDLNGYISGIRYYKGSANTGTHVGSLWTNTGTKLASATFSGETASGWQVVHFLAPVAVTAGTTYVASYHTNTGGYAYDSNWFTSSSTDSPPLHALRAGVDGPDGVFKYGATSAFPSDSNPNTNANYWVDIIFDTTIPKATVVAKTPAASATSVPVTVHPTATFNRSVNPATIAFTLANGGTSVAGTTTYDSSSNTATFTPASALTPATTYTASVSGATGSDGGVMDPVSWSFTTASPPNCPCTIWPSSATPGTIDSGDSAAIEVGVRFQSDFQGTVTAIRYYKSAANTGTHVGSLWGPDGTKLASATFAGETSSGWQEVQLNPPVSITPGVMYTASYHSDKGRYSFDGNAFANAGLDSGPLHLPANAPGAPNGVYAYGSSAYPTNGNGANYWVDVVFNAGAPTGDTTPPTVSSFTPASGATNQPTSTIPSVTFSKPVRPGSVNFTIVQTSNGQVVPTTTTYDDPTRTARAVPSTSLSFSTQYTATVSGASDLSGNVMTSPTSWTFTTAAPSCPCTIWASTATPGQIDSGDLNSVEIGVKFRSDVSGFITGVRFYKSTTNTGTHVGNLWSSTGSLLASATFTSETGSGWQQVNFASPVAVTAGTTYVASYHTDVGRYSFDSGYFVASGTDNPPLHALKSGVDGVNGVFAYGPSAFPTGGNGANYWVDVVFGLTSGPPDTTPPTVTGTTPAAGATGVSTSVKPTATFSKAVSQSSISFTVRDSGGTAIAGSVAYDLGTRTATFTPSSPLKVLATYTATVSATDLSGNAMTAPTTWSFTTAAPACPCNLFGSTAPAQADGGDTAAVEVGVRFRSEIDGAITGMRFYKSVANTGTHTGTLWSTAGAALATVTFTSETASGWQEALFSSSVNVTANTDYVISYHTNVGHYASTAGFFGSPYDAPPLHAPANSGTTPNGVFAYGSGSFPSTGSGANYWVDAIFVPSNVADLSLTTAVSSLASGQQGTLTFTAANGGPAVASGPITIATTLPSGTSYVSAAGTGWTCTPSGANVSCTNSGSLAKGSTSAVTLTLNVTAPAGTALTFSGSVSEPAPSDPNAANNTSSATTTVAGADVALTMTQSPSSFVQGGTGTYTLTVRNNGPATANTPVRVVDTLPTGLTYASESGTGWTCSASGQNVTCTLTGTLASGATAAALPITVNVAGDAPSSVTNTATATSGTGDPDSTNNQATIVTPVVAPTANLGVTATSNAFKRLSTGTYSIAVSNAGPQAAASPVTVTVSLGSGLTYRSSSGNGWSCSALGSTVTCTRGSIAANVNAPGLSIAVLVGLLTPNPVSSTVSVSSPTQDPDTTNNQATVTTSVK